MKNNIYTAIPDWFNKVQSQSTDNTSTTTTQTTIIGGGGSISMSVHNLFIKSDTTITIDNFTISDLFVTDQITDTENWLTTPLLHTLPNTEVSVTTAAQQLYIGAYDKNNNQIKLYQFSEAISTVVIPENCYYLRASSNKTNTDLTIKYVGLNNFDETQQNKLESSSFQNFLTLVEGDEKGVITNSVQNLSLVFQNPLYYTLDKAGNVLISIDRDALFSQSENPTDDRYVTTVANSVQDILSSKNFKEGLSINGIEIVERNGFLYIKGNLATTGGITTYADDPDDPGGSGGLPGGGAIGDIVITGSGNALVDASLSEDHSVITFTKGWLVDAESDQSITGIKDFINGIKLDGQLIKIVDGVLWLDCSIATTGGITTYATENVDVSTIMDGVVVDEETITKGSDNVLRIKNAGAGSSFDENAMWSALASSSDKQINKSHLTTALTGYATETWVISNYATSSALESVSTKLNDFLEGSDTDNIINKWKELEAFLSGMAETDNLAEILETKADKSYVDSTFVTIATKQTITGEKTFSATLNTAAIKASGNITAPSLEASDYITIAGIKFRKLENGAILVEGNLAATGGITEYAIDPVDVTTIMSGVVADETTITNDKGVLKIKNAGSGSGFDKSAMWEALKGDTVEQINKSHLTDALTGYATESWVTSKNYAVKSTTLAGYGITDGINAVSVTGTGNAVTAAAISGHTLTLTKGSTFSLSGHKHAWSDITSGKPTTLAGYGITDAPTKTGSGASGTWDIGITGNAASASKLQTTHTIWGQNFNGTQNVSGEISDCTRIRNSKDNSLYLGNSDDTGWVYTQDIASHNGVENWAIGITGTAWFQKVNIGYAHPATGDYSLNVNGVISCSAYTGNYIRIECDDNGSNSQLKSAEINNFRSPLYLQYSSSFNLICCKGGGKVGIGTDAPNGKLHVEGNIYTSAIVSAYGYAGNHIRMECDNRGENIASRIDEINNYSASMYLQHDTSNNLICCNGGGKVGIGTTSPTHKLTVEGNTKFLNVETNYGIGTDETGISSSAYYDTSIPTIPDYKYRYVLGWQDNTTGGYTTGYGIGVYRSANKWGSMILEVLDYENKKRKAQLEIRGHDNVLYFSGDILAEEGGTFYGSDIRYKQIIQQVELSLQKIAEAPSFVYHWNKEKMKCDRLNLGGSAQYTQSILPWAVKDNDGFLSMDYATVAYTFSVHTARHLLDYETKTDKEIRKLKNRIKYLEKQLKSLHYEEANIVDN